MNRLDQFGDHSTIMSGSSDFDDSPVASDDDSEFEEEAKPKATKAASAKKAPKTTPASECINLAVPRHQLVQANASRWLSPKQRLPPRHPPPRRYVTGTSHTCTRHTTIYSARVQKAPPTEKSAAPPAKVRSCLFAACHCSLVLLAQKRKTAAEKQALAAEEVLPSSCPQPMVGLIGC